MITRGRMKMAKSSINHHQLLFCFQYLLVLIIRLKAVRSLEYVAATPSSFSSSAIIGKAGSNYTSSSRSCRVVRYLPGLKLPGGGEEGPLPFHLETGYVGVGELMDVQLFYYFVKSERNPKEDPIVLWLTGGPRCSAFSAFAFEIGPIYFEAGVEYNGSLPTMVLNPNSWTKNANIIFLDAPVDCGFSYSKSSQGSKIGDIESARNTYEFLRKWLIEEHPEFQSNPLYISGDSYSGKIIPVIVQELINDIEVGKYPFLNFKGYSIGNPFTNGSLEDNAEVLFAHGLGLISNELYESMKENCKGNNYVNLDLTNVNCSKDREIYEKCISGINVLQVLEPLCPFLAPPKPKQMVQYRRSLATTREVFTSESQSPGCRSYGYLLAQYWANDDRVRNALHIRKGTVKNWIRCNYGLPYEYEVKSSIEYHRNLSTKGYRSLIYCGDHDMWVSHISTEAWIRSLNLSIVDDWRPWLVSGQIGGYTRTYSNGMTYATVKGGGHTAPEYRPKECFAMFERWVSHNPL